MSSETASPTRRRRTLTRAVRLAAYGWLLTTILLASAGVIPWTR